MDHEDCHNILYIKIFYVKHTCKPEWNMTRLICHPLCLHRKNTIMHVKGLEVNHLLPHDYKYKRITRKLVFSPNSLCKIV